jgi:hypothetical protein
MVTKKLKLEFESTMLFPSSQVVLIKVSFTNEEAFTFTTTIFY